MINREEIDRTKSVSREMNDYKELKQQENECQSGLISILNQLSKSLVPIEDNNHIRS